MEPDSYKGLRLAYLVSQYPAVNHTFILREIRHLRALGVDVDVFSIQDGDRPPEAMTADEREEMRRTSYVKSIGAARAATAHLATMVSRPRKYFAGFLYALRLGNLDLPKTLRRFLYFIESVIVGREMMRRNLRHAHLHFSSTVGLILERIFPVTISITIHGPDEFTDPIGFHLSEKVAAASFLCVISNYAKSQLMRVSESSEWEKFEVVPLGIDPDMFRARQADEAPDPFRIICVGRVAPVKAHTVLVAAISRIVSRGKNVQLRIVGDGPSRKSLEADIRRLGVEQNVQLMGAQNHDRVLELYREADAFALPSFAEGVPVVLMEAMAMEIPCVATRIMGIPELIRDRIDGLLVDPADELALSDALETLMGDAALRRRLGEAGRRRVLEKYDLNRNSRLLADVFRKRLEPTLRQRENFDR